jgi:hypothetical protein
MAERWLKRIAHDLKNAERQQSSCRGQPEPAARRRRTRLEPCCTKQQKRQRRHNRKAVVAKLPVATKRNALGKVEAADTALPAAEPSDALVVRERTEKEAFVRRTFRYAAQTKAPRPELRVCMRYAHAHVCVTCWSLTCSGPRPPSLSYTG